MCSPTCSPGSTSAEAVLNLEDFRPSYPEPDRRKPVVIHSPSNLAIKGTEAVLRAIEHLKTQYDFEFRLIHRVPRAEALALLAGLRHHAGSIRDRFIRHSCARGDGTGQAGRLLSQAKVVAGFPSDAPFVNANQENLTEILGGLLSNGERRRAIGCQSRAYVDAHHDARQGRPSA